MSTVIRLSDQAKASESMTARTEAMVMKRRQPSNTALATRSASAAMRLTGEARSAALRAHFEQFAPTLGTRRVCPR